MLNTIKKDSLNEVIEAWKIIDGVKKDENLLAVVNLIYNMNKGGSRLLFFLFFLLYIIKKHKKKR